MYYKHERFDAIIPFSPMPAALAGPAGPDVCEPWEQFGEDWLELSVTGQIFHETFRSRFQQRKTADLPRPATPAEKQEPNLGSHGYGRARNTYSGISEKTHR